jgi:hypothetical protein
MQRDATIDYGGDMTGLESNHPVVTRDGCIEAFKLARSRN